MKPLGATDPSAVASYRLIGVLGGGGMGRVYLGESKTGRRVAIKLVREELAEDPVFRRRFAREVAAAKVVSPLYTAAVVDADPNADAPWLATTYIDGPNLTELVVKQGPLSPRAVLTLAAGLSEALASIHRAGLVHRDLKPSNVIINGEGPHIIDFGIALTAESTGRLTTSKVVGTPSYIAPEIIQGAEPTTAGDVFSLGATLVFAASGKHLVAEGTVYSQILQITSGRFDLTAVPRELRPLIVRCISPEPKDRPTADELAHILVASGVSAPVPDWYSSKEPAPVVLAGPDPKTLMPLSRRRLLVASGLLGAAALGSAIGVAAGIFGPPRSTDASAIWRPAPPTGGPTTPPPPRSGPGSLLWEAPSGARDTGVSSGAQQPGVRIIVDAPRRQLIASSGSDVFAVSLDRRRIWTCPLPTSSVNLRRWGDVVLAYDPKTVWLIDMTDGKILYSRNLVEVEQVAAVNENPDNLVVEIGAVAVAGERAFVGLGTGIMAIGRDSTQIWRKARPWRSGGRSPVGVPRAASNGYLAVHTMTDTRVEMSLRRANDGEQVWVRTYDPGPQTDDGGGPPPPQPPPGQGGNTQNPPPPDPSVPPPRRDYWTTVEGSFGANHLVLRDGRAVRVLQLGDGNPVWQTQFDRPVDGIGVVNDLLVVAGDRLSGYPLDRDVPRWRHDLRGVRFAATPDGKRIIITTENELASLDLAGTIQWRAPLPESLGGRPPESITVDDHVAYLTFKPPSDRPTSVAIDAVALSLDDD